jgi:NitT/TauT family transport system substrate-binding protein
MQSKARHLQKMTRASLARREVLAGAAAFIAAPLLVACSKPVPVMRVGCIVFPGYELMFLAREKGLLNSREVRLIELRSNTDTLDALASGQLEAAALTLDELMSARADGVDLRVALVFDVSLGADVVMAQSGTSLANLRGKRIGVEESAMGAVMLSALLQKAGLAVADVQKVDMTLDQTVEVFNKSRLDAIVTAEPWAAMLEKQGAVRLFDSAQIPGRILDVLAVRADAMDLHADAIRHLVSAHLQARKLWTSEPTAAVKHMAQRMQTAPEEVSSAFKGLHLPDLQENRKMLANGGTVHETSHELMRVMFEAGLLPNMTDAHELAEPRFLPDHV